MVAARQARSSAHDRFEERLSRRITMSARYSPVTVRPVLHIVAENSPTSTTARVMVVGEVDMATAPQLRQRLVRVLRAQRPAVLEIDLAGVTLLDCAGVGALVGAWTVATQAGCRMRVRHPQPIVRRVLEVTGILDALTDPTVQP
jgi:anti-anti-sigma factor